MKPRGWIPVTACLVLLLAAVSMAQAANRVALVIGNGAYSTAPLRNPPNDARDIAQALRDLNFDVIEHVDADEKTMVEAIDAFYGKLKQSVVGLFYYAGHGMQVDGYNYLIPVGARVSSESDVRYEAIEAERVLGKMEDSGNDVNIVFLDACRDNPFARSFRSGSRGLVRMDAPKGTFIAYATEPGSVAVDGTGRNSPFTGSLLKHLRTPGLKIEDVVKRVRVDVTAETGDKQLPWQSSSLMGDFYFKPAAAVAENVALTEERKRLEDERRRLEQLKAQLQAQKQQEERVQKASLQQAPEPTAPPQAPDTGILGRDGQYVAYANGVVKDTKTGLEWIAGPDRDLGWYKLKDWVSGLKVDGGRWRIPTEKELVSCQSSIVG